MSRVLDQLCKHSPGFCKGVDEAIPRQLLSNLGVPVPAGKPVPSLLLECDFNFGRANNNFHSLLFAILVSTLPCVDFDRSPKYANPLKSRLNGFDWERAVQKWAGPNEGCAPPQRVPVSGESIYWVSGSEPKKHLPAIERSMAMNVLGHAVLADLLTPTAEVAFLLQEALSRLPRRFLGVQLRQFEGPTGCEMRMGKWNHYMMQCQTDPDASPVQVCDADAAYIKRVIHGKEYRTIFVAHDSHARSLNRVAQMRKEYDHVATLRTLLNRTSLEQVRQHNYHLALDMAILVHSHFFIGTPASTVALNIAKARSGRAAYGLDDLTAEARTNFMLPCGQVSLAYPPCPAGKPGAQCYMPRDSSVKKDDDDQGNAPQGPAANSGGGVGAKPASAER